MNRRQLIKAALMLPFATLLPKAAVARDNFLSYTGLARITDRKPRITCDDLLSDDDYIWKLRANRPHFPEFDKKIEAYWANKQWDGLRDALEDYRKRQEDEE